MKESYEDGTQWLSSPTNFLFPESAASLIYRAKFRDAMKAAGLYDSIDSRVWQQHWQVDVLPVADRRAELKYLAPYVFRVAISDNRIEQVTDTHVTYREKGVRHRLPEPPAGCCTLGA
jgi:hypothetical protein